MKDMHTLNQKPPRTGYDPNREYILRFNSETREAEVVTSWPTDGSAGMDTHYRNKAETDPHVSYRTAPASHVDDDLRRLRAGELA